MVRFFCCRDRAGVKPFFYYIKDGLFLFSSELKSFHKHVRFEKKLNLASVSAFMQYGNVPTPHSIFENTFKLKPGHFLAFNANDILDENVLKPANQKCYWNVYDSYNKPKINLSFDEAKNETKKILKSACDYRMVADVPVGVFLSGGYDSASVTALLQNERAERLKTFTISVPDIGLDEAPLQKKLQLIWEQNIQRLAAAIKRLLGLSKSSLFIMMSLSLIVRQSLPLW